MTDVAVLGGGMGGLSAAYELAKRGVNVHVYEKLDILGGKARSFAVDGSGTDGRDDLPAEHGFRFFPGFYRHVTDTMKSIPYNGPGANAGDTVFENLEEAPEVTIAMVGKAPFQFPSDVPSNLNEFLLLLSAIYNHDELGIPRDEAGFFLRQIFCFLGSCEQRRLEQYEAKTWWEYIDADNKSEQYKKICARGLTRSLVAMRSEEASTLTVGTILVQILLNIVNIQQESDRVLRGPTNDVWITPWRQELEGNLGVQFDTNAEVLGFNDDGNAITGVEINIDGTNTTITADHYVCALPVEVVTELMSDALLDLAGITGIKQLRTAWMNGIMYYVNRDVRMSAGHGIYADSTWAVTSISQKQFWRPEFDPANYGNGQVVDILSSIISEWDVAGTEVFLQPAWDATSEDDLFNETWAQLKAHRELADPPGNLNDMHVDVVDKILDPAVQNVGSRDTITNSERLLINTVNSRNNRPESATAIGNLFLASDYVRTNTDLATMEAANEAGRRAANGILDAIGATAGRAEIWGLEEPDFFDGPKAIDEIVYAVNPNSEPPICSLFDWLLDDLISWMDNQFLTHTDMGLGDHFLRSLEAASWKSRGK